MQINLLRCRIGENACDGILKINGEYICDTAENSQYRTPAGTYRLTLRFNKKFGRKVPTLISHRSGKVMKACLALGNGIYHRNDGRIIVGTHIVPGCVKCSYGPFILLYDRINTTLRRGHHVTLKIIEFSG